MKNRLGQRQKRRLKPRNRCTRLLVLHDCFPEPCPQALQRSSNQREHQDTLKKPGNTLAERVHAVGNIFCGKLHPFGRAACVCNLSRKLSCACLRRVQRGGLLHYLVRNFCVLAVQALNDLVLLFQTRFLFLNLCSNFGLPTVCRNIRIRRCRHLAGCDLPQPLRFCTQRFQRSFCLFCGFLCRVKLCLDPALLAAALFQVSFQLVNSRCKFIKLPLCFFRINFRLHNDFPICHFLTTLF